VPAHDLLRAETVLDRHDRRPRSTSPEPGGRGVKVGRFRGDDAEVEVRKRGGIGRPAHGRREVVLPGDAEAVLVESPRVLLPAREDPHLGHLG
jgi:hypothetical protein